MNEAWEEFASRLRTYPAGVHKLLPPCSEERLNEVQASLGTMPNDLADMLRRFDGAQLFIKHGPLLSIFRSSINPSLSSMEWAADWCIDQYTPAWRASHHRPTDWAIGMMNYGGLILLDKEGSVREWDTSQHTWEPRTWTIEEWLARILEEGDAYLNE